MERAAPEFDRYLLVSRTEMARRRVDGAIQLARDLGNDSDKEARILKQRCKACHYFSRMAGQAFTSQPCAACGTSQTYSSTNTDVLCMDCAKRHDLCKHCGGDLEMRAGRRNWPTEAAD